MHEIQQACSPGCLSYQLHSQKPIHFRPLVAMHNFSPLIRNPAQFPELIYCSGLLLISACLKIWSIFSEHRRKLCWRKRLRLLLQNTIYIDESDAMFRYFFPLAAVEKSVWRVMVLVCMCHTYLIWNRPSGFVSMSYWKSWHHATFLS